MDTCTALFIRYRERGEARALSEVFDRTSPELLRLAIHLAGEVGAAEDLVQATFVTAIERSRDFDGSRALEPWLAGILTNHARSLRREARRKPDLERLHERLQEMPLDEAIVSELSGEIAAALDQLPEPYRRTLILRVRHGLSSPDIAHVLGESPGAVRVRIHRGLELLKKLIPGGLALSLVAFLEPARGMSVVKKAVLAEAAKHAVLAGTLAGAGGILVGKKILIGVLALVVLSASYLGWRALQPNLVEPMTRNSASDPALAATPPVPSDSRVSTELQFSSEVPAERTTNRSAVATDPVFHIGGRVVDGESGAPLGGAQVELFASQHVSLFEIKRRWYDDLPRDWNGGENYWSPWPWIVGAPTETQLAEREPLIVCAPADPETKPVASWNSRADGSFDFASAEPNAFLVCKLEGYAPRLLPARKSLTWHTLHDNRQVEEVHEFEGVLVRLFRTHAVHGWLIDEQGERLHERVRLQLRGWRDSGSKNPNIDDPDMVGSWTFETSPDGSFETEVAASRVDLGVVDARWSLCNQGIHPDRHERWSFATQFKAAELNEPLLVVLRHTRVLHVFDAHTHEPVESFNAIAHPKIDGWMARFCGHYFAPHGELPLVREQRMWGNGGGEMDERMHEFIVWAPGYAATIATGTFKNSDPDVEIQLVHGDVPRFDGLILRSGKPLADVRVSLCADAWNEEPRGLLDSVSTDLEGRFAFNAPSGKYVVRFVVDGHVRAHIVDLPMTGALCFELAREAEIHVRVLDASGAPRVDHVAAVQSPRGQSWIRHTDAKGELVFDALAAGKYQVLSPYISTTGSFHGDFFKELELVEGEHARVEVTIPADDPRFAKLVVAGESDLSRWRVRKAWGSQTDWHTIESDGRIAIDIQRTGADFEIENEAGCRWAFRVPKDPPPDFILRIDPKGPTYQVDLVDSETREPLRHVAVIAHAADYDRSAPTPSAWTDENGRVRLTGLSPAPQSLTIRMRALEPDASDLLQWNHGSGTIAFEPSSVPSAATTRISIAVPVPKEGRYGALGVLKLTGDIRVAGRAAADLRVTVQGLIPQSDGVLLITPSSAWNKTDPAGHFEAWLPHTPRLRALVPNDAAKKNFPNVEWDSIAELSEQSHDLEFP